MKDNVPLDRTEIERQLLKNNAKKKAGREAELVEHRRPHRVRGANNWSRWLEEDDDDVEEDT